MAPTSLRITGFRTTATRRAALAAGAAAVALGIRRSASIAAQATPTVIPPTVERWAAAWNDLDPAAMAALFTEDGLYEDLAFGASHRGRDGVAEWVTTTASLIPDARVDLVAAYQAGDRATAEWVFSGSVPGPAGPAGEATRVPFSVRAASLFELTDGLIRHVSDYYNPNTVLGEGGPPAAATPPPA